MYYYYQPYLSQFAPPVQPGQRPTYSEDLLRSKIGSRVTAYMSYDASSEWKNLIVRGELITVGRDYFVVSDEKTGKDKVLLMINLNFLDLESPITPTGTAPQFPPRPRL